jgi:hypothetical protein
LGQFEIHTTSKYTNSILLSRANSTVQMACAKEFLLNANRAYRLVDQGKSQLKFSKEVRKSFMDALRPIIGVRDVNEHGTDHVGKGGSPPIRPKPHVHLGGQLAVDETSIITIGGEMLMGPLKLSEIYSAVEKLRQIAGIASLQSHLTDPQVK